MQLNAFTAEVEREGIVCRLQEPMKNHTTFRIGGNADVFVKVSSTRELKTVLNKAKEFSVPLFCIGKGSNLLVSDKGIEGAVVSLCGLDKIQVDGNRLTSGAGATLSALCGAAKDASLTGLEFAYGIPGSVGGALYMNAGAYGGEMSQTVVSAECMTAEGEIKTLCLEQMELGYRTSIFKNENLFILSVTFRLEKGEKQKISAKMNELIGKRKEKQPLDFPSAGSTFKRPEGFFAGALIEQNGLKGVCCGGAEVSEKHAGFIINKSNATSADVCSLIKKVQDTVFQKDGVKLETEVMFVGRE